MCVSVCLCVSLCVSLCVRCYMCVRVEFVVAVVIAAVVVRHNAESCLPPQREISHSHVSLLYVALGPLAAAGFTCFFGSESLGGMEFRPPAAAHAAVDVAVSHGSFARLFCFVLFCLVGSWVVYFPVARMFLLRWFCPVQVLCCHPAFSSMALWCGVWFVIFNFALNQFESKPFG